VLLTTDKSALCYGLQINRHCDKESDLCSLLQTKFTSGWWPARKRGWEGDQKNLGDQNFEFKDFIALKFRAALRVIIF